MKTKYYWKVTGEDNRSCLASEFGAQISYKYILNRWVHLRKTGLPPSFGLCIFETRGDARKFHSNNGMFIYKCKAGNVWFPKQGRLINPEDVSIGKEALSFNSYLGSWPDGILMTDKVMLVERSR